MNPYSVRLARKDEVPLLSVLFRQVYIETYGIEGITWEFSNFMDEQFSIAKINAAIESDQIELWVATYKDNPIGVLQLLYKKTCPIGDIVGPEINKLYVLRHFYGKDVGKILMQKAEEHLKVLGNKSVWLWVYAENARAINFYKKLKYQDIGIAYFQMEENNYKNVVLQKQL